MLAPGYGYRHHRSSNSFQTQNKKAAAFAPNQVEAKATSFQQVRQTIFLTRYYLNLVAGIT